MTPQEFFASPVAAAIPPAVAGAWLAYLRYKLAARRLELGKCPTCDKPETPDLPAVAPLLLLLLSVGAGMLTWAPLGDALARAAGSEQPTPGQKPPAKSCDPPCGRNQSCVNGKCEGQAEERRPRRAERRIAGSQTSATPPAWQDIEPQPFPDREPDYLSLVR